MNRYEPSRSNAANAMVQIDCPWCAEPIRVTEQELADGSTCSACRVVVRLEPAPMTGSITLAVPVAA